jgi:S-DNA-T family DNA segregation ATPase FtsK/SpoIIIE
VNLFRKGRERLSELSTAIARRVRREPEGIRERSLRPAERPKSRGRRSSKPNPLPKQEQKPQFMPLTISTDTKLDLVGLGFLLIAGLTTLGYFTEEGQALSAWINFLTQLFGWGAVAVPVGLALFGLWLLKRRFGSSPPIIHASRVLGLIVTYAGTLTLIHYGGMLTSTGITADEAWMTGQGGGWVGAKLYLLLDQTIGVLGTAIALAGWLLVGILLTFEWTFADLIEKVARIVLPVRVLIFGKLLRRVRRAAPSVRRPSFDDLRAKLEAEVKAEQERAESDQVYTLEGRGYDDDEEDAEPVPARAVQIAAPPEEEAEVFEPEPELEHMPWELPDYADLLEEGREQQIDHEQLITFANIIENTLISFNAPGKVVEVNPGPVVTQFGVEPDYIIGRGGKKNRVKVNKIAALADDISLALAARTIRIEAPVPGKGYVGVEVPNTEPALVSLRDVMENEAFQKVDSTLALALGQAIDGRAIAADLTTMPHLLIAGTTGAGKSVCVNGIITALLLQNTPEDLQFILVDPKRVELTPYNGLPHLRTPVVTDLERIVGVLQWVTREMDERFRKFSTARARDIESYNARLEPGRKKMPYMVVIIDELADLMMLAPDETEKILTRLAAMARATGIHLVIATQRPSTDVITGLIKANFPARIAFAVASSVDSRVILDMPGAEALLGRGDMLFQAPDASLPVRIQGVFVSDPEIRRITDYWIDFYQRRGGEPGEITLPEEGGRVDRHSRISPQQRSLWEEIEAAAAATAAKTEEEERDELYEDALALVREMDRASVSMLQRHFRIGYTRAARLIDIMEDEGLIGPPESGSKPREVFDSDEVEAAEPIEQEESAQDTTEEIPF